MPLPKITTSEHELVLPSNGKTVKYRPFLVKEEKILMMALESKQEKDITQAVKDIVKECTFNKVSIDNMPMFDVEYIFLNIRAKSVGEVSNLKILCPDDKKTYADVELDRNEVNVQVGEDHTNKIDLGNGTGMIMQYPSIDSFKDSGIRDINASNMLEVISTCILQIYEDEGKKVYNSKDQTQKELTDFIEQLNTKRFKDVQKFFDTMPKLSHTVKVINPNTKKENEVVLEGLQNFFG